MAIKYDLKLKEVIKNKYSNGFIDLTRIDEPDLKISSKNVEYFRIKAFDIDNIEYRFNTSKPINSDLMKELENNRLPFSEIEPVTGTYKKDFNYFEVKVGADYENKFIKKSFQQWKQEQEQTNVS